MNSNSGNSRTPQFGINGELFLKKISVKDIKDDNILARDVITSDNQLLFKAGSPINRTFIARLIQRNIRDIYVKGSDLPEGLEHFDNESLSDIESEIDSRFKNVVNNDIMLETLRIAKKINLERALQRGEILTKSQLQLLSKLKELPALPTVYKKLAETINDPRATIRNVARIISDDPKTAKSFLDLIKSPLFNFRQHIDSIDKAVSLIGFEASLSMILCLNVVVLFPSDQLQIKRKIESLWGHSLGTATIAKIIARKIGMNEENEIFTAGLLHDIGKIIIAKFCPDDYFRVEMAKKEDSQEAIQLELKLLGYSHIDAGRIIAERWAVSPLAKLSITLHHDLSNADQFVRELSCIHIADVLSHSLHFGSLKDNVPEMNNDAWNRLRLQIEDIEPILLESERIYEEVESIFFGGPIKPDNDKLIITIKKKNNLP